MDQSTEAGRAVYEARNEATAFVNLLLAYYPADSVPGVRRHDDAVRFHWCTLDGRKLVVHRHD